MCLCPFVGCLYFSFIHYSFSSILQNGYIHIIIFVFFSSSSSSSVFFLLARVSHLTGWWYLFSFSFFSLSYIAYFCLFLSYSSASPIAFCPSLFSTLTNTHISPLLVCCCLWLVGWLKEHAVFIYATCSPWARNVSAVIGLAYRSWVNEAKDKTSKRNNIMQQQQQQQFVECPLVFCFLFSSCFLL